MKKTVVIVTKDNVDQIKGSTNWEEFDKLTDEDIRKAAESDPDVPILSNEELNTFKRVKKRDEKSISS